MTSNFWNDRYSENKTVYGENPNEFFKEQLLKLKPGRLLLPAEGEGRNAVFAAKHGWQVDAFDYSEAAKMKALALAAENKLIINYSIQDISDLTLPVSAYQAIALIYVHLEVSVRKRFHKQCVQALKNGGHLIVEAFSKAQIKNTSGGPKDDTLLYDLEDMVDDFKELKISVSSLENIRLNEGPFHQGKAAVIRILAIKPL